jgi:hypothetical protein
VNKPRKERAAKNPFARKRRANGTARYLNKREAQEWRGKYERGGNLTAIYFDKETRS